MMIKKRLHFITPLFLLTALAADLFSQDGKIVQRVPQDIDIFSINHRRGAV